MAIGHQSWRSRAYGFNSSFFTCFQKDHPHKQDGIHGPRAQGPSQDGPSLSLAFSLYVPCAHHEPWDATSQIVRLSAHPTLLTRSLVLTQTHALHA